LEHINETCQSFQFLLDQSDFQITSNKMAIDKSMMLFDPSEFNSNSSSDTHIFSLFPSKILDEVSREFSGESVRLTTIRGEAYSKTNSINNQNLSNSQSIANPSRQFLLTGSGPLSSLIPGLISQISIADESSHLKSSSDFGPEHVLNQSNFYWKSNYHGDKRPAHITFNMFSFKVITEILVQHQGTMDSPKDLKLYYSIHSPKGPWNLASTFQTKDVTDLQRFQVKNEESKLLIAQYWKVEFISNFGGSKFIVLYLGFVGYDSSVPLQSQ